MPAGFGFAQPAAPSRSQRTGVTKDVYYVETAVSVEMPAMIATQPLTFEQYLELDDGHDERYELVDGRLVKLPPESEPNTSLANFLFFADCDCWDTFSSGSTLCL
ncbi:MAG: hypothetical protein AAFQ89_11455 [Cyanobacteria bacterium J06626_18]